MKIIRFDYSIHAEIPKEGAVLSEPKRAERGLASTCGSEGTQTASSGSYSKLRLCWSFWLDPPPRSVEDKKREGIKALELN